MSARKLPAPQVDPETKTFWDGLGEGVLRIKACDACGEAHYYPRHLCPHCGSEKTRWVDTRGAGEIYSLSVMRRGEGAPFAVAYVMLDEGLSMLTNLVGDDLNALAIGQRVRLAPHPSDRSGVGDGQSLPFFTPCGD